MSSEVISYKSDEGYIFPSYNVLSDTVYEGEMDEYPIFMESGSVFYTSYDEFIGFFIKKSQSWFITADVGQPVDVAEHNQHMLIQTSHNFFIYRI